jgi:hypothetical protein
VDLTPGQRRTLRDLIGRGRAPPFDPSLADRTRERLDEALADAGVVAADGTSVWLGKRPLTAGERCQALFRAIQMRERPEFEHSTPTAAGALLHKAIELDIGTEREADCRSICCGAADRLRAADRAFRRYWSDLDRFEAAELVAEAGRRLGLFRDSFPPLPRAWSPQAELRVRVRLAGGGVVLSGAPDLVIGRSRRLVVDFKSGRALPEHPEDMRFYALLLLLRTGVPPYRVATFFLDSGEWQAEDVTDRTIERAMDRVVEAAALACRLSRGLEPTLSPGGHCRWCPRRSDCPAVDSSLEMRSRPRRSAG